jgi:hypothetical protein
MEAVIHAFAQLWQMASENQIVLEAAHITCIRNVLADQLNQKKIKIYLTKWYPKETVVQKIWLRYYKPHIDHFFQL